MIEAIVLLSLTSLAIALWLGIPAWRLKRALARPFPAHHRRILRRNIALYGKMPLVLQQQLQRLIKQFLHQKKFIGCDGVEITDEIRVTIAAQACMLLLNCKSLVYPALHMVLVYPSAFVAPRADFGVGGVVTHASPSLAGESWSDGRVILAWDHTLQGGRDLDGGHNVVLHEFAHQLDSESGSNNGAPFLPSRAAYRRWSQICAHEFARLQQAAEEQGESVMDYYGASSPAEFFAVATETFFGKAPQMAEAHPELYEELRKYYKVDPKAWH